MIEFENMLIIGVDHGYGNIKTANCVFPTGLMKSETEPTFTNDLLVWEGKYYTVGVGHKEFTPEKMRDEDFYVLTLAAIACELRQARRTEANVYLAVGLPLTWVSGQRADFRDYLLQREEAEFSFRGVDYRVRFAGADVFPQGFAAVADKLGDFTGVNMLCDIGNGTMNIMYITDRRPDVRRMFTEKYGTHQCVLQVRESVMREHHAAIDDSVIGRVLRTGTADIGGAYLETVTATAREYAAGILRKLREHEYDPNLMNLYVVGGGGCLVKNFADYDVKRAFIDEDVCAAAQGYEYMAEMSLRRRGGA